MPAKNIRKADWIFQMRESGVPASAAGFRGYRLHVDLKAADKLPQRGLNSADVRLLTKDATLALDVAVVDVQVVVEYLAHRNGVRDAEDYYQP